MFVSKKEFSEYQRKVEEIQNSLKALEDKKSKPSKFWEWLKVTLGITSILTLIVGSIVAMAAFAAHDNWIIVGILAFVTLFTMVGLSAADNL